MKSLIAALVFMLLPLISFSQDIIIKHDSIQIKAKVLEVSLTEVRYKNFDHQEGPTFVLNRNEVHKIKYPNGKETIFEYKQQAAAPSQPGAKPAIRQAPTSAAPAPAGTSAYQVPGSPTLRSEMYNAGRLEALTYYKGGGPFWGTAAATFATGIGGILVGGIMMAIPPRMENQVVSDRALLNNPDFRQGYTKQAHSRKIGKVAGGFGVGLGALIFLVLATSD